MSGWGARESFSGDDEDSLSGSTPASSLSVVSSEEDMPVPVLDPDNVYLPEAVIAAADSTSTMQVGVMARPASPTHSSNRYSPTQRSQSMVEGLRPASSSDSDTSEPIPRRHSTRSSGRSSSRASSRASSHAPSPMHRGREESSSDLDDEDGAMATIVVRGAKARPSLADVSAIFSSGDSSTQPQPGSSGTESHPVSHRSNRSSRSSLSGRAMEREEPLSVSAPAPAPVVPQGESSNDEAMAAAMETRAFSASQVGIALQQRKQAHQQQEQGHQRRGHGDHKKKRKKKRTDLDLDPLITRNLDASDVRLALSARGAGDGPLRSARRRRRKRKVKMALDLEGATKQAAKDANTQMAAGFRSARARPTKEALSASAAQVLSSVGAVDAVRTARSKLMLGSGSSGSLSHSLAAMHNGGDSATASPRGHRRHHHRHRRHHRPSNSGVSSPRPRSPMPASPRHRRAPASSSSQAPPSSHARRLRKKAEQRSSVQMVDTPDPELAASASAARKEFLNFSPSAAQQVHAALEMSATVSPRPGRGRSRDHLRHAALVPAEDEPDSMESPVSSVIIRPSDLSMLQRQQQAAFLAYNPEDSSELQARREVAALAGDKDASSSGTASTGTGASSSGATSASDSDRSVGSRGSRRRRRRRHHRRSAGGRQSSATESGLSRPGSPDTLGRRSEAAVPRSGAAAAAAARRAEEGDMSTQVMSPPAVAQLHKRLGARRARAGAEEGDMSTQVMSAPAVARLQKRLGARKPMSASVGEQGDMSTQVMSPAELQGLHQRLGEREPRAVEHDSMTTLAFNADDLSAALSAQQRRQRERTPEGTVAVRKSQSSEVTPLFALFDPNAQPGSTSESDAGHSASVTARSASGAIILNSGDVDFDLWQAAPGAGGGAAAHGVQTHLVMFNARGTELLVLSDPIMSQPKSVLAKVVTGDVAVQRDEEGRFVVDRDPGALEAVLAYLQSAIVPSFRSAAQRRAFERECLYWHVSLSAAPATAVGEPVQAMEAGGADLAQLLGDLEAFGAPMLGDNPDEDVSATELAEARRDRRERRLRARQQRREMRRRALDELEQRAVEGNPATRAEKEALLADMEKDIARWEHEREVRASKRAQRRAQANRMHAARDAEAKERLRTVKNDLEAECRRYRIMLSHSRSEVERNVSERFEQLLAEHEYWQKRSRSDKNMTRWYQDDHARWFAEMMHDQGHELRYGLHDDPDGALVAQERGKWTTAAEKEAAAAQGSAASAGSDDGRGSDAGTGVAKSTGTGARSGRSTPPPATSPGPAVDGFVDPDQWIGSEAVDDDAFLLGSAWSVDKASDAAVRDDFTMASAVQPFMGGVWDNDSMGDYMASPQVPAYHHGGAPQQQQQQQLPQLQQPLSLQQQRILLSMLAMQQQQQQQPQPQSQPQPQPQQQSCRVVPDVYTPAGAAVRASDPQPTVVALPPRQRQALQQQQQRMQQQYQQSDPMQQHYQQQQHQLQQQPAFAPQPSFAGAARAPPTVSSRCMVIFSGGTAFNDTCAHLKARLCPADASDGDTITPQVYVLPVSDDGGSSAEIQRVVGGPSIGDIRSRLVRLADDSEPEGQAIKRLLMHRLPSDSLETARAAWYSVLEGHSPLWADVGEALKESIRSFLVHFNTVVMQRSSRVQLDMRNASVGNFFFTGARLFMDSLDASLFWFARVARVGDGVRVLPALTRNTATTIGAQLGDDSTIIGQCNISHPVPQGSTLVVKDGAQSCEPLPAHIRRIFYVNEDRQAIQPPANPSVLSAIASAGCIVYAMGSLWTSLAPSLILHGVGEQVAAAQGVTKILLMNGWSDRETTGLSASQYVDVVVRCLNRVHDPHGNSLSYPVRRYVTHLFYPESCSVPLDMDVVTGMGIAVVPVKAATDAPAARPRYDSVDLANKLAVFGST